MTTFDDEDLRTHQREVQRLLGRCMLRLQQYERLIKAMVVHYGASGPILELERTRAAQIDGTARKTLGTLVGELLGTCVIADKNGHDEDTPINSPENVNWFAMQTSVGLSDADFAQAEQELGELVGLRNNLVHHFIEQHDIWSVNGCRRAKDALVTAYSRIDRNLAQLREWAEEMKNVQQAMSNVIQSAEFADWFDNGIAPDGTVESNASGIVTALREAFGALAADGWAHLVEAGKWIVERYPEQLPAKYGYQSWRQVVHESPILELRYFEMHGQRMAFYREKESTENPL
jgi:hypothetical protein|uniref:OST-HTH/LOTUS domain-containing protein n=1 Tax=Roseovarius sp. BRH_c41 TaxID=1629709 RepID=UPI000A463FF4|nr:OST-HTH/LOTUS domain-containing protein [Roseovarius sp. BRH_c41]